MKVFWTVVITLVALIIVGIAFAYSGIYDVSAIKPEGKLQTWFFSTMSDNSIGHHAKSISPPSLGDSAQVVEGFKRFNRMCVGCHGAPGVDQGGMSKAFNPQPPNLVEGVSDLSDAEIFWIIKNGIKMTAMPGFGLNRSDDEIWQLVSFVHLLPKMTAEQFQDYRSKYGQEEGR